MEFQNILRASKRLARIIIPLHGDDLTVRVSWLRAIDERVGKGGRDNRSTHFHSSFEVHAMVEGQNDYTLGTQDVQVRQGQLLLITPDQVHRCIYESKDYRKYAICFNIEAEGDNDEHLLIHQALYAKPYALLALTPVMRSAFEQVFTEIYHARTGCITIVRTYVIQILYDLARQILDSQRSKRHLEQAAANAMQDPRILEAQHFIQSNLASGIRCADVAAHMHMSTRQMDRISLAECGKTLHELMEGIRHVRARQLLLESDMTIREISERVGFSNEYNFNRFFTRVEGMSAGKFRRARHEYVLK